MSLTATQLPLRLSPQEIYRLDNFFFEKQEISLALEKFCQLDGPNFIYLWGENASGKSHILLACAEQVQKAAYDVVYLSLDELKQTAQPTALQSIGQSVLVCIDDLESVAGLSEWEEALFHFFNDLQQSGCKLLIASQNNPNNVCFNLPDLRSRLATGLIYQLTSLNDEDKQQALILQAQTRGLILPEEVAQYLLRHYGRDMRSLMTSLQQLDKASLAAQRRLTIPFVRQVLMND